MKYITLLFCGLVLASCNKSDQSSTSLDCLPANLQSDIIAFYPFSSGTLNDASGNDHHLSNTTTAVAGTDREGNTSCAFKFNLDNGEYLTFTDPVFLDGLQSSPFSISIWYTSEIEGCMLMSRGNDTQNCRGAGVGEWGLGLFDNNWPVFGINSYRALGITPNYQINEWHHVVVTVYDTDLKVYQDGTLIEDMQNAVCNITPTASLDMGDLFIGDNFKGTLDDIIIYNRLLSPSEVAQLAVLAACCN
jgi:hypothetical protein